MPLMRKRLHGPATLHVHVLHGSFHGPVNSGCRQDKASDNDMLVATVNRSLPRDKDKSQVAVAGVLDAKQVRDINVRDVDRFCDVLKFRKQGKPPIGQTKEGSRRDSLHSSQIAYVEQLFNDHGFGIVNGCTQPAIGDRLRGPVREWGVTRP